MKKLILFASLVIIMVSTSACSLNSNSANPSENSTNNQPQESQQTNQVEEETAEKPSTDENSKSVEEEKDTKIFKGDGFTLEYPKEMIATEEGLWIKDRYDLHLKNIANNTPGSFSNPDIDIDTVNSADSLEKFVANYYAIDDINSFPKNGPNSELMWMEKIKIHTYDAMIVSNNEHIGSNTYFIKENNKIHVFSAYKEMVPYIFFVDIMSSLKFD